MSKRSYKYISIGSTLVELPRVLKSSLYAVFRAFAVFVILSVLIVGSWDFLTTSRLWKSGKEPILLTLARSYLGISYYSILGFIFFLSPLVLGLAILYQIVIASFHFFTKPLGTVIICGLGAWTLLIWECFVNYAIRESLSGSLVFFCINFISLWAALKTLTKPQTPSSVVGKGRD